MRSFSQGLRSAIYNNDMTGYPHVCRVALVEWVGGIWENTYIPNLTNVNVTRTEALFSNTATFTINNVNPSDLTDYGYYNPHRSDPIPAHLKPQNEWYLRIVPNVRIKIYMGLGSDLCSVFYGLVDSIEINTEKESCKMQVTCRDMGKRFLDDCVHCIDSSEDPTLVWSIAYPIDATVTPYFLTSTDTDPKLEDIVTDICSRAGFGPFEIITDDTGLKLSDTIDGYLEFTDATWDECINRIIDLTVFEFWIDEDGIAHFGYPPSRGYTITNEEHMLISQSIPVPLNYPTVIPSSLVVKSYDENIVYHLDFDYFFDAATNSITIIEDTGDISPYDIVKVSYSYADFIFRNGMNIKKLSPFRMSHEKIYGRIKVIGNDDGIFSIVTVSNDFKLWDGSNVSPYKMYVQENKDLLDEDACLVLATRLKQDMLDKYINIDFEVCAMPFLQIRDLIQIEVYGTVGQIYIVTGITFTADASSQKISQTISAYHYTNINL